MKPSENSGATAEKIVNFVSDYENSKPKAGRVLPRQKPEIIVWKESSQIHTCWGDYFPRLRPWMKSEPEPAPEAMDVLCNWRGSSEWPHVASIILVMEDPTGKDLRTFYVTPTNRRMA